METIDLKGHPPTHNTISELLDILRRDSEVYVVNAFRITEQTSNIATNRLTKREKQVIACVMKGHKNKVVATLLATTEQVVKNYLRSIYQKTGVETRLDLVLYFQHHHLENILPSVPEL